MQGSVLSSNDTKLRNLQVPRKILDGAEHLLSNFQWQVLYIYHSFNKHSPMSWVYKTQGKGHIQEISLTHTSLYICRWHSLDWNLGLHNKKPSTALSIIRFY